MKYLKLTDPSYNRRIFAWVFYDEDSWKNIIASRLSSQTMLHRVFSTIDL